MDEFLNYIASAEFIISVAAVVVAVLIWAVLKHFLNMYAKKNKKYSDIKNRNPSAVRVATGVIRYAIILFTILTVLQINHINVTSLIAGLGIAGAVVGLALQDILKDVIMGTHILAGKFFSVGDVVRYGDQEGVVESFTLTTTRIRNIYDNSVFNVCNRNISEITKASTWNDIDVPLSYNEDFKKVHEVLKDICGKISKIDGIEDCVYKGTQSFEASAITYKIRVFCQPENKPELLRAAKAVIQQGLDEAEIRIPYNQLDVHHYMENKN